MLYLRKGSVYNYWMNNGYEYFSRASKNVTKDDVTSFIFFWEYNTLVQSLVEKLEISQYFICDNDEEEQLLSLEEEEINVFDVMGLEEREGDDLMTDVLDVYMEVTTMNGWV